MGRVKSQIDKVTKRIMVKKAQNKNIDKETTWLDNLDKIMIEQKNKEENKGVK